MHRLTAPWMMSALCAVGCGTLTLEPVTGQEPCVPATCEVGSADGGSEADAGPVEDAGVDAGSPPSCGPCDAGPVVDAGLLDAGSDAGLVADAGVRCRGEVRMTAAGGNCALRTNGTVWCRGDSPTLGDGSPSGEGPETRAGSCPPSRGCGRSDVFQQVPGLRDVVHLSGLNTIFAVTAAGEIWAWGLQGTSGVAGTGPLGRLVVVGNTLGSFYYSSDYYLESPTRVLGVPPAVEVQTTSGGACARTMAGEIFCWGFLDAGNSGSAPPCARGGPGLLPTKVDSRMGTTFAGLAAGGAVTCMLRTDGKVACMGYDGANTSLYACTHIPNGDHLRFLGEGTFTRLVGTSMNSAAGGVCGLRNDGAWVCRGISYGNLGGLYGRTYPAWTREYVSTVPASTAVVWAPSSQVGVCFAAQPDGRLACEGPPSRPLPVLSGVRSIDSFEPSSGCAVVDDGCLRCWSGQPPVVESLTLP